MTIPDPPAPTGTPREIPGRRPRREELLVTCDRCGTEMHEKNCKLICPNCGSRFDCSDLSIHFD
jgi:ribosomal protein L37E